MCVVVLALVHYCAALELAAPRTYYQKDFETGIILNDTFFPKLKNYHIGADYIEGKYDFVAKVIHSTRNPYPLLCTAVCVDERMFMTTARCMYRAVPEYTRIEYQGYKMSVAAIILPAQQTKQQFNDVALIIVDFQYPLPYTYARMYSPYMEGDDRFEWLDRYRESVYDNYDHTVIGYATTYEDVVNGEKFNNTNYNLTELPIKVGTRFCSEILPSHYIPKTRDTFHVPCYLSCTLDEYRMYAPKCRKYHGVEGGIVWNSYKEKFVGLASWGPSQEFNLDDGRSLPVGYAVPNGDRYQDMLRCAKGVRTVTGERYPGTLQKACDLGD